jgi:hypothetical protein
MLHENIQRNLILRNFVYVTEKVSIIEYFVSKRKRKD